MSKACLVDWTEKGFVIPWMIFPSLPEAIEARKNAHSSWPAYVCEIEDEKSHDVLSRRAVLSGKNSLFKNEKTEAFRALSVPTLFYDSQVTE